jgi:radical SAM protein (TIGR01212 family)
MDKRLYYKYSDYLKEKYGEKVYKLPINLDITCPNRDGTISTKGCYFCSEVGTGFESLSNNMSVKEQINNNRQYIGSRYGAKKFIAYFQNYTNTYMPIDKFEYYVRQACDKDIVEIDVSTRPDCIDKNYLDILKTISIERDINITIELGLQTSNEETLKKINRGHGVNEFINAVNLIKQYDFNICTHLILNLPWDTISDVINSAELINKLRIPQVKLHSLYIAYGTVFEEMYKNNDLEICSKDEYINRVITFLSYLDKNIVVQRLLGRAPKEETVFCNWGISWWKIRDEIEEKMLHNNIYQGKINSTLY